jgi:hypothetical protein
MNNLNVCDVLCQEYSEYFGLTEDEVKLLLKDFNQNNRYEEIKKWYNGYAFGNTTIYNPWSTLKSVKSETIDTYWKNTASEEMIENSFLYADEQSKLDIISLYEDGYIIREVDLQMTLDKHFSKDIVSLLLASGYLKVTQKIDFNKYKIEIVNNEIKQTYKSLISKYVKDSAGIDTYAISFLVDGFMTNDIEDIKDALESINNKIHYFQKGYEASYHATLFATLSLDNSINVKSEVDAGRGRVDLVIYFKSHKCLIEIKRCSNKNEIDDMFEKINKQIDKRNYREIMDPQDTIYGIVFANDDVDVRKL